MAGKSQKVAKVAGKTSGTKSASKSKPHQFLKLSWQKLFWIFVIGCIFGDVYEVVLNFIMHLFQDGSIFLERRSGVIYGPFSIIYGVGAVLMAAALAERNYKWWQLFLYGGFLCSACEYLTGWLQQTFTGTMSWDYSTHPLNLNGRTSLPIFCVWGVVCVLFIAIAYPLLSKIIDKILSWKHGRRLTVIFAVVLALDMFISFSAVIRMGLRHRDVPAYTPYGQLLDAVYPDSCVRSAYPNTEFVEDFPRD